MTQQALLAQQMELEAMLEEAILDDENVKIKLDSKLWESGKGNNILKTLEHMRELARNKESANEFEQKADIKRLEDELCDAREKLEKVGVEVTRSEERISEVSKKRCQDNGCSYHSSPSNKLHPFSVCSRWENELRESQHARTVLEANVKKLLGENARVRGENARIRRDNERVHLENGRLRDVQLPLAKVVLVKAEDCTENLDEIEVKVWE